MATFALMGACSHHADEPSDSYAHKVFDDLTTVDGKKIIETSGYAAN